MEIEKQTYDQVRMIAGAVARELSKRKITEATIDGQLLADSFSALDLEAALTAFVEGWNLGTYRFLTYKSQETAFITKIQFMNVEDQHFIQVGEIRAEDRKSTRLNSS